LRIEGARLDWLGADPGLRDRILLNYTRIENAHKICKKTFVFYDVQKSTDP